MMLNLKSLLYFVSLYYRGSVGSAAAALNIPESTLRDAIRRLESVLGKPLFLGLARDAAPSLEAPVLANAVNLLARGLLRGIDAARGDVDDLRSGWTTGAQALDPLPLDEIRRLLESGVSLKMIAHFIAVYETGSIRAASKKLGLAQPHLSQQIARLEAALGVRLFERGAAGVKPLAAADRFYGLVVEVEAGCHKILRRADVHFVRAVHSMRLGSVLPLGVQSGLAKTVSAIAAHWVRTGQSRPLFITNAPAEELIDAAARGRIDAAIVDVDETPVNFCSRVIGVNRVDLVGPPSMIGESREWRAAIERHPVVAPSRRIGLRHVIDAFLAQHAPHIQPTLEIDSFSVIGSLIQDHGFCSLLPETSFDTRTLRVSALPLPGPPQVILRLVWRNDARLEGKIQKLEAALTGA